MEWIKRTPNPEGVHSEIEIRQVFEAEDFGEEFTPELREQEERIRAQAEGNAEVRFVVFRKADDFTEAGGMPTRELAGRRCWPTTAQMIDAGVLLEGMGLRPSREGVRVLFDGTGTSVVDGPFTESKELVAGFALLQTRTREEAIEWLRRWPTIDADGQVRLELREVAEEGDARSAVL